jgi:hypothetical protein
MDFNYTLKFRTFDQLLEDVTIDLNTYALENMIEPQQLIKVAKRVTYDLGLRINMTKEIILEVEHHKIKLPDDFFTMNFGSICGSFTQQVGYNIGGTTTMEVPYVEVPSTIDMCAPPTINCSTCNSNPCNHTVACPCEIETEIINTCTLTTDFSDTPGPGFSITVNGIAYPFGDLWKSAVAQPPSKSYIQLEANLNAFTVGGQPLGQFSITPTPNDPLIGTITVVGTNIYDSITVYYGGNPYTINFTCTSETINIPVPNTPILVPQYDPNNPFGNTCIKPRVFSNCKGEAFELIQVLPTGETRTYGALIPLRFRSSREIECDCPNLYLTAANEAWIKDGYLHTSFDCGKVYLNYQGALEDEDGNLLVPDHDEINEYYEYAMKQRIFENLYLNGEDVSQKLQLIEQRLKAARNYALSIVNTPNFAEMKGLWMANRRAQYSKYYDMFKSFNYNSMRLL